VLIPLTDVLSLVPIPRSTLYLLMSRNDFPKPIKVGKRVLWDIKEIEAWRDKRMQERDATAAVIEALLPIARQ
jgi:prophage regulatory protein